MILSILALDQIVSALHIERKLNYHMKIGVIQKCESCGKEFHEWSCDYCYAKIIINQVAGLGYNS